MITTDDHRHGTFRGYVLGCRRPNCPLPTQADCTRAHRIRMTMWRMGRTASLVDVTGTRRRIEALMVMGWPTELIGAETGMCKERVCALIRQQRPRCMTSTATKVAELYERWAMTFGPSTITRSRALTRGFLPPLAWDDIDTDAQPAQVSTVSRLRAEVDEVVVLRALRGERVHANPAERQEVIRRWEATGQSLNELQRQQGWQLWRDSRTAVAA